MKPTRATLLLTRPEAQSQRFAEAFRERFGADWPIVISPLMRIAYLDPGDLPEHEFDLIFTSENAVAGYARLINRRAGTAWCVGRRTEDAALRCGFRTRVGPGNAAGLVEAIRRDYAGRPFLWPRAVHAARNIATELSSAGIETIPVVVYDQQSCEPTPEALRLTQRDAPILLPLFSPRAAIIAAAAFPDPAAALFIAAMSPAVARAADKIPARRLVVAEQPDDPSMLAALGALARPDKTA
ncbi:hypothetical protein DEA8626_02564 [Defluviimonas aquaemixtae]|uniref:Tetrapyrrole biosynthesis uroporphyrinogen III synthase domain-containing protein n=1 Tax=Albidovulum aquaemixtae TaxID=1542388 RepID=A0A2R8BJB4_9RHOB|nr:uroporphyrinogen-III synthase [Defluviimonas aquaemixtae]SPH23500.1 hypothetical protein DEA8626_02564 [Defluviimonas aquaemixtae]